MDNNENKNNQSTEEKFDRERIQKILDKGNTIFDEQKPIEKKKMSAAKIVGIVLLCIIGIPIIVFGVCLLIFSGYS
ncbi:MAG: hypothetical protein A2Y15_03170 [Clostridiales bacterium GWF2_36_10]|nr:MAG: hypothetical protein A2Y15_03170 [Clostridiales bacterium GWF2_36_10]HAN20973.1 hypothetical protein [Clostridiales bacterium]